MFGQIANIIFYVLLYFILGAVRADAAVPAQLANLSKRLRILVVYDAGSDARYYSFPRPVYTIQYYGQMLEYTSEQILADKHNYLVRRAAVDQRFVFVQLWFLLLSVS
ncbi:hypothetical protein MJ560_00305 [Klebsiella pneumoniae]|nr:hypothetical protein MJ560_00305 [Klebsiella pneumoniae]